MSVFFLQRILPLILIGGGVTAGTGAGQRAMNRIVDTVKTVVCTMELGEIADAMQMDSFLYGDSVVKNPGMIADYIRNTMKSKNPNRDTSLDLWLNPYLMQRAKNKKREKIVILRSTGANGKKDQCGNTGHIQVRERMDKDLGVISEIGRRQAARGKKMKDFFDDPSAMDDPGKIDALVDSLGAEEEEIEDPYKIPKDDDICVQVQIATGRGLYQPIPKR
jgi:hypothetical protein